MGYTPKSFDLLLDKVKGIREKYQDKKKSAKKPENLAHLKLIDAIEAITHFIEEVPTTDTFSIDDKRDALLAVLLCFRQSINSADYSEGYIYNSGSILRGILTLILDFDEEKNNVMSERDQLICLSKYYKNVLNQETPTVKDNPSLWNEYLNSQEINLNDINKRYEEVTGTLFKHFISYTESIEQAIPTETAIEGKMSTLPNDYQSDKNKSSSTLGKIVSFFNPTNPNRDFYTQLAKAVADIAKGMADHKSVVKNPAGASTDASTTSKLNYSERIEIGALLYILHAIYDEYIWRSPANNNIIFGYSYLFHRCCQVLHIKGMNDYDDDIKKECITTFRDFLAENAHLTQLENYGNDHFPENNSLNPIHAKAHEIRKKLAEMIEALSNNANKSSWPATLFFAQLFSMIGGIPGYALGWVSGSTVSQVNKLNPVKEVVSKGFNYAGNFAIGSAGQYFGFWAASAVVNNTVARALAKAFEKSGEGIGYIVGGILGLPLDLSYKAFCEFCHYCVDNHKAIQDLKLLKDVDVKLLICFLDLPRKMFHEDKKFKLQKTLTDHAPEIEIRLTPMKK